MKVELLEEKTWMAFLYKCSSSTFFHTPYWYKVWQAYMGYQYEARLFTFSDNQKIIFPLAWRPRVKGLFKEVLSGPAGVYGGPLSPQPISKEKFSRIWHHLKQDFDSLNVRVCPYQEMGVDEFVNKKDDITQTLLVTGNEIDEIINGYSKNHKRSFRTSKKYEIKISCTDSIEEWQEYHALYQECVKRWGENATNAYDFRLFELIRNLPSNFFKLWICKYKGNLVAGALVFYFNKSAIYWHGATDANFYTLKPMHLLQTSIIESLVKGDLSKWYDFNPSGGHEGVVRFKRGFGAEVLKSDIVSFQSTNMKLLSSLRKSLYLKI